MFWCFLRRCCSVLIVPACLLCDAAAPWICPGTTWLAPSPTALGGFHICSKLLIGGQYTFVLSSWLGSHCFLVACRSVIESIVFAVLWLCVSCAAMCACAATSTLARTVTSLELCQQLSPASLRSRTRQPCRCTPLVLWFSPLGTLAVPCMALHARLLLCTRRGLSISQCGLTGTLPSNWASMTAL